MKKIIFISDFNLSHSIGGAQRSNEIIINKGRELGKEKFIENCKNAPEIFWKSII